MCANDILPSWLKFLCIGSCKKKHLTISFPHFTMVISPGILGKKNPWICTRKVEYEFPEHDFPEESEVLTCQNFYTTHHGRHGKNSIQWGRAWPATFLPGCDRAARAGFKQLVRSAQFEARSSTKVRIAPFVKLVSVWDAIRSHFFFQDYILIQFGCSWKL